MTKDQINGHVGEESIHMINLSVAYTLRQINYAKQFKTTELRNITLTEQRKIAKFLHRGKPE